MNQRLTSLAAGLGPRVATGLVLAALAVAVVLWAPVWLVAGAVVLLSGLGMWEFSRMILPGPWRAPALLGLLLAAALPLGALLGTGGVAAGLGLALFGLFLAEALGGGGPNEFFNRMLTRGWGVWYVGGLFACLLLLLLTPGGRLWILFLVAAVVASDVGAYFTGSLLGRHKLAPLLSPHKTLEGLAGGLIISAACGAILGGLMLPDAGWGLGAILALVAAVMGVAGDLLESVIKRVAGAKDSGTLLPGHGGILDRLDAIMMAGPALLLCRVLWWP